MATCEKNISFDSVLEKAARADFISRRDVEILLSADGDDQQKLFGAARRVRDRAFGGKVFLYGFIYFSTFCKNDCTFCFYRSSNNSPHRYRKTLDEILAISKALKKSGVHLIDLTMGEDPKYLSNGEAGLSELIFAVQAVKRETGLPVMISPGVIPDRAISMLSEVGAEWYACYQETYNADLFNKLRIYQSFDRRMRSKAAAIENGVLVEDGILVGVGESAGDIVNTILGMGELGAAQVRVMTFVPQEGAPLAPDVTGNYKTELNTIAAMRLLYPNKLIPASLDVEGKKGLRRRLDAGANVVTSIIAPEAGLAGVSNSSLDIASGARSVEGISDTLRMCGLTIAGQDEYLKVLKSLKEGVGPNKAGNCWWEAAGS